MIAGQGPAPVRPTTSRPGTPNHPQMTRSRETAGRARGACTRRTRRYREACSRPRTVPLRSGCRRCRSSSCRVGASGYPHPRPDGESLLRSPYRPQGVRLRAPRRNGHRRRLAGGARVAGRSRFRVREPTRVPAPHARPVVAEAGSDAEALDERRLVARSRPRSASVMRRGCSDCACGRDGRGPAAAVPGRGGKWGSGSREPRAILTACAGGC